jgi:hypothetical protein
MRCSGLMCSWKKMMTGQFDEANGLVEGWPGNWCMSAGRTVRSALSCGRRNMFLWHHEAELVIVDLLRILTIPYETFPLQLCLAVCSQPLPLQSRHVKWQHCIMQTQGCGSFYFLSTMVLKRVVFPFAICCVNVCSSCLQWQCTVAFKRQFNF